KLAPCARAGRARGLRRTQRELGLRGSVERGASRRRRAHRDRRPAPRRADPVPAPGLRAKLPQYRARRSPPPPDPPRWRARRSRRRRRRAGVASNDPPPPQVGAARARRGAAVAPSRHGDCPATPDARRNRMSTSEPLHLTVRIDTPEGDLTPYHVRVI